MKVIRQSERLKCRCINGDLWDNKIYFWRGWKSHVHSESCSLRLFATTRIAKPEPTWCTTRVLQQSRGLGVERRQLCSQNIHERRPSRFCIFYLQAKSLNKVLCSLRRFCHPRCKIGRNIKSQVVKRMQNALASGIVDVGVHIATLLATQHIAKLEEKGCKIF